MDGPTDRQNDMLADYVAGPDFRCVRWAGVLYSFTSRQASVVRVLWELWQEGTPEASEAFIRDEAEVGRLSDVFRIRDPDNPAKMQRHEAWGPMIAGGRTRGTFRLAERVS